MNYINIYNKIKNRIKILFIYKICYHLSPRMKEKRTLVESWFSSDKAGTLSHIAKQQVIEEFRKKYLLDIFIEGGTLFGEMVDAMRTKFSKIYSIELDKSLCENAKKKFENYHNINILCGNSGIVLESILADINQPCLFWLDGHYSGVGTAKGDLQTPIRQDLSVILNHKIKNHVILIDDARCFNGDNDYPMISEVWDFVKLKNKDLVVEVKNDMIIIHSN